MIVDGHGCHTALHFSVKDKENQDKVPMLYWLPKLHKKTYNARLIANSSSCTTTELSKMLKAGIPYPWQRDYYLYKMVSGWSLAIDQATVLIWSSRLQISLRLLLFCFLVSKNDNIFVIIIGIFLF